MMNTRNKILLSVSIMVLFGMFFFVIFGENGLADLNLLRHEKLRLLETNKRLKQENLSLYREIDRLKTDLTYIENVARQELGMVKAEEIIFKLKGNGKKRNGE